MARVFLSYARDDADAARRLAADLGESGHEVWWDRHLHGGSRFSAEIDKALKNAEAVVVLWSEVSVESAWVQDEAAEGRDSGRLVPVAIAGAKPPLGFRQFHTIDLGSWTGQGRPDALGEILEAIAQIVGVAAGTGSEQAKVAPAPQHKASVCVLPFANMSGESEQEYFSDGISEDIITDLSNVSALSVVARNTSFMFKGQTVDVKEVAGTLGVSHVLEGSVRKAGNRVRITAQLIDGAKGDHVWAARFDRDLTDIFEIQDEISKAIVDALQVKLLPKEKSAIEARGTTNADAYNFYLLARQTWITGTFGDAGREQSIIRLCHQATLIDPNYAEAWALMALAQLDIRFYHGRDADALPAAERALAINPRLAEPHCVKARHLEELGKLDEAEQQMLAAIKLNPESWEVNREAARMLFRQDRIPEAIPYFRKAASLMDLDWSSPMMLMTCYDSIGDKDRLREVGKVTLERINKALAKDPTNGTALASGAYSMAMSGDKERAREWMERALILDPDNLNMRYNLACTMIRQFGDRDETLATLQPFFDQVSSPTFIRHLEADPDLDSLRGDARFEQMVAAARQRLGMAS